MIDVNEFYIDYKKVIAHFQKDGVLDFDSFVENCLLLWEEDYAKMAPVLGQIATTQHGQVLYLHDHHSSQIESKYELPSPPETRVIGCIAISTKVSKDRCKYFMKCPLNLREFGETPKTFPFDRGHYIAHSIGGYEHIGLFPQRTDVNRGRSEAGRLFRSMESKAFRNPGTIVLSRPFYGDHTCHPFFLEYTIYTPEGVLLSELFDNRYTFAPYEGSKSWPKWYSDYVEKSGPR